jgi:hypothetical protein
LLPKIEALGSSTNLNELEKIAQISQSEEATHSGLREKVEALRSGNVQARLQVARREQEVCARAAGTKREFDLEKLGSRKRGKEKKKN